MTIASSGRAPLRWPSPGIVYSRHYNNLAGGYDHDSPDHGHGFSAYADVALAVDDLRRGGVLADSDRVIYVDLDGHQGNGVCRCFKSDPRVLIYDQYNGRILPATDDARFAPAAPAPLRGFAIRRAAGATEFAKPRSDRHGPRRIELVRCPSIRRSCFLL